MRDHDAAFHIAAYFINEGRAMDVTFDVLMEALLRAYMAVAENYPAGIAGPVRDLRNAATFLQERADRAREASLIH